MILADLIVLLGTGGILTIVWIMVLAHLKGDDISDHSFWSMVILPLVLMILVGSILKGVWG